MTKSSTCFQPHSMGQHASPTSLAESMHQGLQVIYLGEINLNIVTRKAKKTYLVTFAVLKFLRAGSLPMFVAIPTLPPPEPEFPPAELEFEDVGLEAYEVLLDVETLMDVEILLDVEVGIGTEVERGLQRLEEAARLLLS